LSNNLSKKEHLVACFEVIYLNKIHFYYNQAYYFFFLFVKTQKLFQQWYDYCLDYKQNLLTRNNLLYYGVIYTKSLITEVILLKITMFYDLFNS